MFCVFILSVRLHTGYLSKILHFLDLFSALILSGGAATTIGAMNEHAIAATRFTASVVNCSSGSTTELKKCLIKVPSAAMLGVVRNVCCTKKLAALDMRMQIAFRCLQTQRWTTKI